LYTNEEILLKTTLSGIKRVLKLDSEIEFINDIEKESFGIIINHPVIHKNIGQY